MKTNHNRIRYIKLGRWKLDQFRNINFESRKSVVYQPRTKNIGYSFYRRKTNHPNMMNVYFLKKITTQILIVERWTKDKQSWL